MLHEGDVITIDGTTGNVYAGEIPTVEAEFFAELATLLAWADDVARLEVMANADTPRDAERAPASTARWASGSAAPSGCSTTRSACRSCRR